MCLQVFVCCPPCGRSKLIVLQGCTRCDLCLPVHVTSVCKHNLSVCVYVHALQHACSLHRGPGAVVQLIVATPAALQHMLSLLLHNDLQLCAHVISTGGMIARICTSFSRLFVCVCMRFAHLLSALEAIPLWENMFTVNRHPSHTYHRTGR